jgi:hypothetical protein
MRPRKPYVPGESPLAHQNAQPSPLKSQTLSPPSPSQIDQILLLHGEQIVTLSDQLRRLAALVSGLQDHVVKLANLTDLALKSCPQPAPKNEPTS